jgi:hypothetical protein
MKLITSLKVRWKGLLTTLIRFPLTIILLTSTAVLNAINIHSQLDESIIELMTTLYFGALLSAVLQLIYERFSGKNKVRLISFGITIAASGIFYPLIRNADQDIDISVRIAIIFFILAIAFLWAPVIRGRADFNHSFMAVFQGAFSSAFFTGILFLGITIIIATVDALIVKVGGHPYEQSANIVFFLLAPIYFLSLIPVYAKDLQEMTLEQEERITKATSPVKFLEVLISYIIIPITAVFTIILLLYIAINIRGEFWTNNLMEPILISYCIAVIIIYLLAGRMINVFTEYFRLIFPKVLVPVVLFQTISSVIRGVQEGITYERYYVILFGVFAIIAGVLFCIVPIRKNGVIAPILIVMLLISIVPPVDAFTVSRISQINRLENTLNRNQMLEGDVVTPKADISKEDQNIIIDSFNYLSTMGDTKDVTWLAGYNKTSDFEKTFGFVQYTVDKDNSRYINVQRDESTPIPIEGYDYLMHQNLTSDSYDSPTYQFEKDGKNFTVGLKNGAEDIPVIILTTDGQEILRFDTTDMFNKYIDSESSTITADTGELTFIKQNESAVITVVIQNMNVSVGDNWINRYADAYILVDIK